LIFTVTIAQPNVSYAEAAGVSNGAVDDDHTRVRPILCLMKRIQFHRPEFGDAHAGAAQAIHVRVAQGRTECVEQNKCAHTTARTFEQHLLERIGDRTRFSVVDLYKQRVTRGANVLPNARKGTRAVKQRLDVVTSL
jgi:hypothetical protein